MGSVEETAIYVLINTIFDMSKATGACSKISHFVAVENPRRRRAVLIAIWVFVFFWFMCLMCSKAMRFAILFSTCMLPSSMAGYGLRRPLRSLLAGEPHLRH